MSLLAAVMAASVAAPAFPQSVRGSRPPAESPEALPQTRPAKGPIETVTKIVGRAVTTVRPVVRIVERAPEVAPGRIRPCSQGRVAPDVQNAISSIAAEWIARHSSNQAAAAEATATIQEAIARRLGQAADASGDAAALTTEAIIDLLGPFLRSHLLNRLAAEAEACPEFVERVVTTVITQLRPETEPPKEEAAGY